MKNTIFHQCGAIASTILFGVVAFLFWRFAFPHALVYQEQYQLFLFDSTYLLERLSLPGGTAAIMAEYLTQYYNHITIGAIIQSLLLVGIQVITWFLMKRNGKMQTLCGGMQYISSFFPSVILWYALSDESVLTTYSLSLIWVLTTMLLQPVNRKGSILYTLLAVPALYWIAGPLVLLYALFASIQAVRRKDYLIGFGILIYALFCILISAQWLPYPTRRLFTGLFYYRFVDTWSATILLVIPLICLLAPYRIEERISPRWEKPMTVAWGIIVIAVSSLVISSHFNDKKFELMKYDYLLRRQQWDAIIAMAEEKQPDLPMSVCATNLALGMKNQLGHRAFQFFQHGTEGLIPKFERDFSSALVTGEVFFHLGLINTAQRHAFEAMESIPNYNKSGRIVKRLAETNLINGQYKVAEKYLRMLEKTTFYRTWAQEKLQMIGQEEMIDKHPVYGRMRQLRLQNDFLFSDTELDKIFGQLFIQNPNNSLAVQYLLLHPLLNKDINGFMNYLTAVQEKISYNPPVCQEAIVFAFSQRQQAPPPGFVNEKIMQGFRQFVGAYSNHQSIEAFKGTLWYYLMKE